MTLASRRFILQGAFFGVACACAAVGAASAQAPASPPKPGQKYVCPPCGCAADGKEFDAPGACPECGMPLVAKPADPKAGAPAPKLASARQTSAAKSAPA
ncbi:heavy metal-binding domain-containing protein [Phenylobacterium sp.]|uniref:heavy metal-binding domain-containing protein n=1 Tax=Phenylobacterium sp. TaxID=1871053 RepID=UPI002BB3FE20|nr:heavy metal-binding domain-containing protein [Phenylobacterium sp.]HLZ76494.1 heavy metal-binding domain-containing protein [Phenylobacterium sp.]